MKQPRTLALLFLLLLLTVAPTPAPGQGVAGAVGKALKSATATSDDAADEAKSGPAEGGGGSAKPAEKAEAPALGSDEQLKALQAGLAEAQRLRAGAEADMSTSSLAIFGASKADYERHAVLTRSLTYEFERAIEQVTRLRKLQKEKDDGTNQSEQIQAFLKQAPYTIDLVDDLRGQCLDARVKIDTLENRASLVESEIERTGKTLKDLEVQLRQLQEKQESVKDKISENRLGWQRDQAQLNQRLSQARLNSYETERMSVSLDLEAQREKLALLERKLSIAAAGAPFTQAQLEEKLARLRKSQGDAQKEMEKLQTTRDAALKKLEESRAALAEARQKAAAAAPTPAPAARAQATTTPTPPPPKAASGATSAAARAGAAPLAVKPVVLPERYAQLQAAIDLRKEEADTATAGYGAMRVLVQLMDFEQQIWEARARNIDAKDTDQFNENMAWITERTEKIGRGKTTYQTNLDLATSQIAAQQARLDGWKPEDGEVRTVRAMRDTFQARANYLRRGLEQLRHSDRLLQSWQAEIQDRLTNVPWTERAAAWARSGLALARALWDFELFATQETIVVGGHAVTEKTRSITVGKLLSAILIVLVGIWICQRLASTVRVVVRRRFHARENSARLLYKSIYSLGIFLVIMTTMMSLKIPLTLFAFLGGALAIGIGFGAQNLINNFISGLILMFERPIKIGDIVEVEGQRGKVVNIGGRCSRIKRFDGIDILIPNSSFLEKSVVNWTLSDILIRQTIKVGVAYGSPTRQTGALIEQALREQPHILRDPAPVVVLEDFGDSAMIYAAYFWVELREHVDSRIVGSEVRCRIDDLFREAGIIMAYPTREIYLNTQQPLHVSLSGDGGKE